ncbi:hypothetical protein [Neorhizobium sp. T6_25]|uniref:hypothetical protein n=1 Tax=Neorhizobium sp. T6_25 TaxID=2093833 RepID=UPI00155F1B74|nr:hypothetical protein [Neorhizobium sp. T6_25]
MRLIRKSPSSRKGLAFIATRGDRAYRDRLANLGEADRDGRPIDHADLGDNTAAVAAVAPTG